MKWLDIVKAWTWARISDAEFIAAAELQGALHVHAARTLIKKDFEENYDNHKNKFCFFGNESNRT